MSDIEREIDHCEPSFELDLAINLGMITTELVSNVLEHAFDDESGKMIVRLERKGTDKHTLVISDNGIGISHSETKGDKLGLELVSALCDQINGELSVRNGVGTSVEICF